MIKLKTVALATIIATMATATCAQAKTDLANLPSEAMWQEHANLLGTGYTLMPLEPLLVTFQPGVAMMVL